MDMMPGRLTFKIAGQQDIRVTGHEDREDADAMGIGMVFQNLELMITEIAFQDDGVMGHEQPFGDKKQQGKRRLAQV